jgi:hypothetical protein
MVNKIMADEEKGVKCIAKKPKDIFYDPNKKQPKCSTGKKKLKDCSCVHQKRKVKPPKVKDIL